MLDQSARQRVCAGRSRGIWDSTLVLCVFGAGHVWVAHARRSQETGSADSLPDVITGDLKGKIDRLWDAFWSGGTSNPLEVIQQITYLLFMRRLDDLQTLEENKARRLGIWATRSRRYSTTLTALRDTRRNWRSASAGAAAAADGEPTVVLVAG